MCKYSIIEYVILDMSFTDLVVDFQKRCIRKLN